MKNSIAITIMILLMSCSKKETPQPIVAQPPASTQSTVCTGIYRYEVILSNPLSNGDRVDVIYTEYDGNVTGFEQITTAMSLDTSVNITQPSVFNIYTMQLAVGLVGGDPNQTIQNSVILNIYHNSTLVSTSGSTPIPLCFKGTMSSTSCAPAVVNTYTLLHQC